MIQRIRVDVDVIDLDRIGAAARVCSPRLDLAWLPVAPTLTFLPLLPPRPSHPIVYAT